MAGKRGPTSNLNHDNWDEEDEPEDQGVFRVAGEEELRQRVIKKARRTHPDTASSETVAAKSLFGQFTGFSNFSKDITATSSSAAESAFAFLSKIPAVANAASSSTGVSGVGSAPAPSFSFGGGSAITTTTTPTPKTKGDPSEAVDNKDAKSSRYYGKLKGLNQAVADWIKTHVDKNPICLLSPIFEDYERYVEQIEKEEKVESTEVSSTSAKGGASASSYGNFKFSATLPPTTAPSAAGTSVTSTFSFGNSSVFGKGGAGASATSTLTGAAPKAGGSIFGGQGTLANAGEAKANGKSDATDGSKISFMANSKPFTFGAVAPPTPATTTTASGAEAAEDEDQPPKVEFTQVQEEDAIYSKKCKVFTKKEGKFVERGIGTLHLKPVKDSDKTQLIVRADTNLGNILINVLLSSGLPAQRMGKNNVMLVCLPTPDESKPTSTLFRVKTGEDADELLAKIEKYSK